MLRIQLEDIGSSVNVTKVEKSTPYVHPGSASKKYKSLWLYTEDCTWRESCALTGLGMYSECVRQLIVRKDRSDHVGQRRPGKICNATQQKRWIYHNGSMWITGIDPPLTCMRRGSPALIYPNRTQIVYRRGKMIVRPTTSKHGIFNFNYTTKCRQPPAYSLVTRGRFSIVTHRSLQKPTPPLITKRAGGLPGTSVGLK